MNTLYTTYCLKSKELEKALAKKGIRFYKEENFEVIFSEASLAKLDKAPFLKAGDGKYYSYTGLLNKLKESDLSGFKI